jgi:hypothetical protein
MIYPVDWTEDDQRVRELLSPFERVDPVVRRRSLPRQRRRTMLLVLAGVAAAGMIAAAALAATGVFGPLHEAKLQVAPPNVVLDSGRACELIGGTAAHAETVLSQNGYQIEWRFQHWGTQVLTPATSTTPGAIGGGYTTTPKTVPPTSVVWDITPDTRAAKTVFVFVQAPDDPNAPQIVTPACSGTTP